ncbi:MAG: hypothetical protein HQL03_07590 [Nitrospirae bacterium]|nr:hypothetical protein [Nitrospirota bacterium]MBF0592374.1 hypothetical protein [Nitrospirota bacterium]
MKQKPTRPQRLAEGKLAEGRKLVGRGKSMPCINRDCRLREKGCTGFEGCPGYKTIARE